MAVGLLLKNIQEIKKVFLWCMPNVTVEKSNLWPVHHLFMEVILPSVLHVILSCKNNLLGCALKERPDNWNQMIYYSIFASELY